MKVNAKINRFDVVKMQFYLIPRLKIYLYWFVFFLVCAVIGGRESIEKFGLPIWGLSVIATALVGFIFFIFICILYQLLFVTEKSGVIGNQEFEILDTSFLEKSIGTETKTSWSSVEKIYKTKKYIYVRIGGYKVHVIPRRHFESTEKYERFHSSLESAVKNA